MVTEYKKVNLIIMKVYCPSKNRPDFPLFSMSENINIIIQTEEDFDLYASVILNVPLLKTMGFKYESYPFDGIRGNKGFSEDVGLLCFCYINKLKMVRINSLKFEFNNEDNSITWTSKKNREKMITISNTYHLGRYREYPLIVNYLKNVITYQLSHLEESTIEDIVNEIVKTVSYETLNFESEKEFEMKKFLIWGLMLLITATATVITSCNQDDDEEVPKVIEEKYRGLWYCNEFDTGFELTKNKMRFYTEREEECSLAYTEGVDLYVDAGAGFIKYGTFEDENKWIWTSAIPNMIFLRDTR
jgi:hypothetical protein